MAELRGLARSRRKRRIYLENSAVRQSRHGDSSIPSFCGFNKLSFQLCPGEKTASIFLPLTPKESNLKVKTFYWTVLLHKYIFLKCQSCYIHDAMMKLASPLKRKQNKTKQKRTNSILIEKMMNTKKS